jgi:hypothetical protein
MANSLVTSETAQDETLQYRKHQREKHMAHRVNNQEIFVENTALNKW